ncbi:phosphoglycolate phosphatase [Halomicrobium zhouii]|uniref:Phosphoglycolate phosphatase n=1 Tax=Halomicrobium zhouii TaxID=767519 RepID=A0A1I6LYH9_9EURY|nr:HAD-IA family hydrolase [Halomicrobium zhouii]SFS08531.1 phosphoglycolate phosphatase [Halomicrobium zhouii]
MTAADYDAVVYDLDGTLVRLDVDWDSVARDVDAALADHDIDTDGHDLWDVLERSVETGHRDIVEEAIAAHERDGAETASILALAEDLPHEVPVGVVSLNCEDACRRALDRHDLADHVDVVIGRDTVGTFKPDPEPLLAAVEELGSEPSQALFVGDSESDRTTAERAGTDFQWVRDRV